MIRLCLWLIPPGEDTPQGYPTEELRCVPTTPTSLVEGCLLHGQHKHPLLQTLGLWSSAIPRRAEGPGPWLQVAAANPGLWLSSEALSILPTTRMVVDIL